MNHDQHATDARPPVGSCIHVLLFQDMPGVWIGRGLEHDMLTEARTIREALRGVVRLIEAHTAFDLRHRRSPLSAFGAAPQSCWNAFTSGTPLNLAQLGIEQPHVWRIVAAIGHRHPMAIPQLREIGARVSA